MGTRPVDRRPVRRRLVLLGAAASTIMAGLSVHFLSRDAGGGFSGKSGGATGIEIRAAADFTGGALYAVLVYLLVAIALPRLRGARAGAIALGLCVMIELFQLTGIPQRLSQEFPPIALLLGSTFAAIDLLAYAVGVVVAAAIDALLRRSRRHARG